jgi:hypothetical protein
MKIEQEPKYTVDADGRIVNRASGEAIPDDEPVFIFRARDWFALAALHHYVDLCGITSHRRAVEVRIQDFARFKMAHPERMKEPDSP